MPLSESDMDELKAMIAVARQRDVNFGLCIGKKPETTILMMHRMKSPDILGRMAKKDGETTKVTFGLASVSGKILTLKCMEEPPGGLVKPTKLFLRAIGAPMKVCIADAEGNLLEEDSEDDDAAEETSGMDDETPNPDRDRWEKVAPEVARRVEAALPDAAEPDKIRKIWDFAQSKAGTGDFGTALAALKPLMPLLSATASATETVEAALARMGAALKDLLTANPQMRDNVIALVQTARDPGADARARAKAVAVLQATLDQASTGAPVGDPMMIWQGAKEIVDHGITALQRALGNATDPNLKRIAEYGLNGATGRNQTAMMVALMGFKSATGSAKADAVQTLLKRAREYRQFLTSNPVIALCEGNPFGVAVTIKAPLLRALDDIEAVASRAVA